MRYWMYGMHAVREALANPLRSCHRLYHTAKLQGPVPALARQRGVSVELADTGHFARVLPAGSVHQGVALQVDTLPPPPLESLEGRENAAVLVLDQVTDPHNVGAILRSAAAFGAAAVIAQNRHAPEESGALAKTASGALEHVPYLFVVNISRTLESLQNMGFWCVGLASEATEALHAMPPSPRVALVLGAEGAGLRPLVARHCDALARLPTVPQFPSLNVSNAAAVALYEMRRGSFS